MIAVTGPSASHLAQRDERTRVILLVGQSISLGIFASLLLITANSLFLSTFGSAALPYAYLAVAALGSVTFYALATIQRSWPPPRLALLIDLSLVAAALAGWLALVAGLIWASFLLVVAIPLVIQAGFVVLGGQVGRLFDVRQIKRLFPRVVFGFATGFMLGGLLSGPLLGWLGRTENLLLPTAAAGVLMTGFLLATTRRYSNDLAPIARPRRQQKAKSLPKLLTRRYALLIFSYQMLAALTSQLLNFILLDRSGARFATSEALARFFGTYNLVLNLTDMLFLALLAGWILSRFGLGLGFLINPASGSALLVVMLAAGALLGPASLAFFVLIALTQLLNIVLTDGAMRTSLNAAYQALPADERTAVQTGVEGIGLPLAIGFAGLMLLIFRALNVADILTVTVVTMTFALLWTGGGWLVYRGYAHELLQTLRRRALGSEPLTLDDRSSLDVALSLLDSPEPAKVRLGLDALENAHYPELGSRIAPLVSHSNPHVQIDALERVAQLRIGEARPAVIATAQAGADDSVRAAALRAWCALDGTGAISAVLPALSTPNATVRAGAVQGLLIYCGGAGRAAARPALENMVASLIPVERATAATALAGVPEAQSSDPLSKLLQDSDPKVRQAALHAAGGLRSPAIIDLLTDGLADRRTRSAATTALAASGIATLPRIELSLADANEWADGTSERLVRVAAQIDAQGVTELLAKHLEHEHPPVRTQVLEALRSRGYHAARQDAAAVNTALHNEAQHGQALLQIRTSLGSAIEVAALQSTIADELGAIRHRMMLLLSLLYDRQGMQRAEHLIGSGEGATRSLALEGLEVMLSGEHRALLFPLIIQDGELAEIEPLSLVDPLQALIQSPAVAFPPAWTQACALYAAGRLRLAALRPYLEAAAANPDSDVRATANWATRLATDIAN